MGQYQALIQVSGTEWKISPSFPGHWIRAREVRRTSTAEGDKHQKATFSPILHNEETHRVQRNTKAQADRKGQEQTTAAEIWAGLEDVHPRDDVTMHC